jgi:type I restriction enzyme S subunit
LLYKFEDIANNSVAKKKPTSADRNTYLGLEHLDSGNLTVTRFGSDVAPIGEKLLMKKGDILFGKRRAYQKKVAIAPFDGIFSAHGMVLRPKEQVVHRDFFPLFINSDYFLNAAIKISVGSLSPTINWSTLKELEFNLPPITQQQQLAKILWAVIEAQNAYKTLFLLTEQLVKSRFVEMFGDPVTNPMGWEVKQLGEVLQNKASNGLFDKNSKYSENGNSQVMWVGDVVNRMYSNIIGLHRISVDESDISRYEVQYGDLLFCRSSLNVDGIGKASMVPVEVSARTLYECHVIRTPLELTICLPEFVQVFTTMDFFRNQIMSKAKTATMTTISQNGITSNLICVPPLPLQNRFAEFVRQADKYKFELQRAISELEATYKAILRENLG